MPRSTTTKEAKPFNPFATAAESPPKSKAAEKGTAWIVGGPGPVLPEIIVGETKLTGDDIADAIAELSKLAAAQKANEAKLEACKGKLKAYADPRIFAYWARNDERPETPLRLANTEGATCTYVVQDKTSSVNVTDAAIAAFRDVLAIDPDDELKDLFSTTESYAFNPDVVALRVRDPKTGRKASLQEVIGRSIGPLLESLVKAGDLTTEEAGAVLVLHKTTRWCDGILDRIVALADGDADVLRRAVDATGGVVRYAQPDAKAVKEYTKAALNYTTPA